jgi:hypothetical protein
MIGIKDCLNEEDKEPTGSGGMAICLMDGPALTWA